MHLTQNDIPVLKKLVHLIHGTLEIDVAVFDPKSRILCCTDEYIRQKGKAVHTPSIEEVIANENVVVNKPGYMQTCAGCRFLGNCPAKIEMLKSIRKDDNLFGVLAFTSFTQTGHDRITEDTAMFANALHAYADWAAELLFNKKKAGKTDEIEDILAKFMEQSSDGMLIIDAHGAVVKCNPNARDLFSFCDLYTRSAYHILPDSIVDKALQGNHLNQIPIMVSQRQALISATPVFSGDHLKYCALSIFKKKGVSGTAGTASGRKSKVVNPDLYVSKILGGSQAMLQIKTMLKKISKSTSTILISGETGTGKGLLAKVIHQTGPRSKGPFVTLNCTSIPEALFESELFGYEEGAFTGAKKGGKPGRLELARGGTLFLDEIGEMPLHMQVKLLNVLQDNEFQRVGGVAPITMDTRVIAATNQDLEQLVEEKRFRTDLFYRLNVIPIELPPLRQRKSDIEMIATDFLVSAGQKAGKNKPRISSSVLEMLKNHSWPGNIRELQNIIEYCVNLESSDTITPDSLPQRFVSQLEPLSFEPSLVSTRGPKNIRAAVLDAEAGSIMDCLDRFGHDLTGKQKTAENLGISLRTLYRKLEKIKAAAQTVSE